MLDIMLSPCGMHNLLYNTKGTQGTVCRGAAPSHMTSKKEHFLTIERDGPTNACKDKIFVDLRDISMRHLQMRMRSQLPQDSQEMSTLSIRGHHHWPPVLA